MNAVIRAYRISRWLYDRSIPLLPRVSGRITRFLFSCEVSYLAELDPSVEFPHKALGVVIGDGVRVGARTRILQNVTLGGRSGAPEQPVIGDDVLIGAGACILGNVTVGDGASIGANAVVLKDVPAGAVAVGIPAKVRP